MEKRIYPPPPPSTPREAPWREIEEIIEGLKTVVGKLDQVISAITGLPPGAIPTPFELQPIVDRLDHLISFVTNKQTFLTDQKDVTTAGTPEQLVGEDADILVPAGFPVTIIAKPANTGTIYLARTKAACMPASGRRFDGLSAGLAVSLKVDKLSKVWVDAEFDGEGISWIVEQD